MFINIVLRSESERSSGLLSFVPALTSLHTHDSLLAFFVCLFVIFHSFCSHTRVFGKTLLHEFEISRLIGVPNLQAGSGVADVTALKV